MTRTSAAGPLSIRSSRRRARIETRVFEWIEASETSLVGEWLGLLKVEPLRGLAFPSAGDVALLLLTSVGWLTFLSLF